MSLTCEHTITVDPDRLSVYDRHVEDIDPTITCPGCGEPLDAAELITDEFSHQRGPGWFDLRIRCTVDCGCGDTVRIEADAHDADHPPITL